MLNCYDPNCNNIKVTGYSCARRAKVLENVCLIFLTKISSTKSVSNLILAVEVHCHKVQGTTEVFMDTFYSCAKMNSSVHQKAVITASLERDSR